MNAKILGIYTGINDVENANWQTLIDKITDQFNKHTVRNLTLKGRAIMAMEMDNIELMVELQVFTHIHDQRAVHRQFIPDTQ